MKLLPSIQGHEDLVKLAPFHRAALASEIRDFIVAHLAKTGGHLASNLGVVELSIAIETVFDTAQDRLVFDVGHQAYVHKLLTGRQAAFERLRMFEGMSGFPKPHESDTDSFVAGHASSSVSIALGMARARKLTGEKYNVITLLGDGAATGGMVYEALNDAGASREPMIVILNDNEMSIDPNVGGMASHLRNLRTKESYFSFKKAVRNVTQKLPGGEKIYHATHVLKEKLKWNLLRKSIFEHMGFEYIGPVDGHDTEELIRLLRAARDMEKPVLIHVITQKGRGYAPAEAEPSKFHGVGKFDPDSGKSLSAKKDTYSDVFGRTMMELAAEDPKVCAITAAMPGGTGLLGFRNAYPDRLFDVGIAEEHAVSMAGGLAKQGAKPVVAIYSTFFQRSYDQIMQDIALLKLPVVLAVDRAGLVGEDGPTHHGVFDVGFLRQVPGMTVLCPASHQELSDMLRWAVLRCGAPVAVRYPRGSEGAYKSSAFACDPAGVCVHREGSDATLITYGNVVNNVLASAEALAERGVSVKVLRLLSVTHIPDLSELVSGEVVVIEEAASGSGIKEAVSWKLRGRIVHGIDLGADFVPHGDQNSLYQFTGLDAGSITDFVCEVVHHEK
ncbi:MAG: 1-deoxy-D-xylulose-5-phosphate synthase [Oscillospiraceae bacterium]|nr:1-deoxy-D-xylulose-5-phosphate synthase [Oscillospiraceae bacterium]